MFVLFSNLLSRPTHGQHRHDGIQTDHYKTGLHSPGDQVSDSTELMSRVLSPLSAQSSPYSSTISLPSNFLCKTQSLPSVLEGNEASFSDTVSESINDQEEFISSVWKLSDLTSLLSLFSLILLFILRVRRMMGFIFPSWFSVLSHLCYSHVFLSYGFA